MPSCADYVRMRGLCLIDYIENLKRRRKRSPRKRRKAMTVSEDGSRRLFLIKSDARRKKSKTGD